MPQPPTRIYTMSNYLNTYNLRDNMITYDRVPKSPEEALCLSDRKWWAFLLSSICTFLAGKKDLDMPRITKPFPLHSGIFIVLLYRLFEFLCSSSSSSSSQGQHGSKSVASQQPQLHNVPQAHPSQPNNKAAGSSNEASFFNNDLGWMAEAKDWAGELISGQSTTGRILVIVFLCNLPFSSN